MQTSQLISGRHILPWLVGANGAKEGDFSNLIIVVNTSSVAMTGLELCETIRGINYLRLECGTIR